MIKQNSLVYAAPGYDPAGAFTQTLRHYGDTARLTERAREAYFERLLSRDR